MCNKRAATRIALSSSPRNESNFSQARTLQQPIIHRAKYIISFRRYRGDIRADRRNDSSTLVPYKYTRLGRNSYPPLCATFQTPPGVTNTETITRGECALAENRVRGHNYDNELIRVFKPPPPSSRVSRVHLPRRIGRRD